MESLLYYLLIFIAGFIDSIAGGGGLITVPVLTLMVGPGAIAIGTNKIVGLGAALTALIVYAKKGHLCFKSSLPFMMGIFAGTWIGSKIATFLPVEFFKYFLLAACPLILIITLKRDSFLTRDTHNPTKPNKTNLVIILGAACGFYDGVFGPGGGTFMFLSLAGLGGYSILAALATSKLANTLSAATALVSFSLDQFVVWEVGLKLVFFAISGALLGSHLASEKAKKIVRPALVIVVILLLIKILTDL